MASRSLSLVPRLGPMPANARWVPLVLLVSALVVLSPASLSPLEWYVGNPAYPDAAGTVWFHWLVHEVGVGGLTHTRVQMFPLVIDMLVLNGFPLDALASAPFGWVFGWPAGYGVYQIAVIWALGGATAWLAGRWWRSAEAACVAGVACQCAAPILREMAFGRSTQAFGAIFVPLSFGFFALALVEQRRRDALLAGVFTACCALSYWYFGFFCGLGIAVLVILAMLEGLPWVRSVVAFTVAAAVIAALPMLYTVQSLAAQQGGMEATLFTLIHFGDSDIRLIDLLEERDALGASIEGVLGITPFVVLLATLGAVGNRLRRWTAPVGWTVVGGLFSLGPILVWMGDDPLPGPFALVPSLPVLRRLWWPDRSLLIVAPAVALLAGGGAERLIALTRGKAPRLPQLVACLLATGLLVEAWVALPNLPMPVTSSVPSAGTRALQQGTGPVLVLPQAGGPYLHNRTILLDQTFHERPLVNGLMPPEGTTAPADYRNFSSTPAMAHLYNCATSFDRFRGDARSALLPLQRAGIREVYVDLAVLDAGAAGSAAYIACVQSLLGPPTSVRGPYEVWTLPSAEGVSR